MASGRLITTSRAYEDAAQSVTVTASIDPATNDEIDLTVYQTSTTSNFANNTQTVSLSDGTNTYSLSGFEASSVGRYWIRVSFTTDGGSPSVDSVTLDGSVSTAISAGQTTASVTTGDVSIIAGTSTTVTADAPSATVTTGDVTTTTSGGPTISAESATATASAPAPTVTTETIYEAGWGRGSWGSAEYGQSLGDSITVSAGTATASTSTGGVSVSGVQSPAITVDGTSASTTAAAPTITTTKNTSIVTESTTATIDAPTPSLSIAGNKRISVDPATATTATPAPTLDTAITATVSVDATTITATAVPPEIFVGQRVTVDKAVATATTPVPSVLAVKNTSVTADPTTASTRTPVPTIGVDVNGYVSVDPVTATIETHYAAANPSHVTVTADPETATTTAPTPAVEMRYPVRMQVESATATVEVDDIAHVEAVSPITSLPGALEGQGAPSTVNATVSPDLDLEGSTAEPRLPANKHYRNSVTETKPEFAEANQRPFPTQERSVYTPERRLSINGSEITVDRDIDISAGEYGFTVADITLYNLDVETWAGIGEDDRVTIDLGWQQGETERVFEGEVLIKRRRTDRHNRSYAIRAREVGGGVVTSSYSRTFDQMSPHRIVEHIAMDVDGISPGYIATGTDRLTSAYTLSGSKELRDWLDRLATKAKKQTGTRWVWYLEGRELAFHPIDEQVTDHIALGMEKSIVRATPIGYSEQDPSLQSYELVMRCEPVLDRGVAVTVEGSNSIDPVNLFRVAEYTHESKTSSGRHHTTAVVAPLRKQIEYPTHR